MYLDRTGLIVQSNGDGGDTAQRTGFYFSARLIRAILGIANDPLPDGMAEFTKAWDLLTPGGRLVRNPNNWNMPNDTSRDQTRPMMIAGGLSGDAWRAALLLPQGKIIRRYPNGDVMSPENWNEYCRAIGSPPGWLGDAFAYGDAYTRCSQSLGNPDDVGDDLNTLLTLVYFNVVQPTKTAKAALSLYLRRRPKNYGNTVLKYQDPVAGALHWYCRPESGGNWEVAAIWDEIIARMRVDLDCPL
jgi:hypothetical protein